MKNLLFAMMLVFASSLAMAGEKKDKAEVKSAATVVLNGSVNDQITNEALVGVRVELVGTNQVSYTDFDGNYAFENLQPGIYEVTASYVSYETKKLEQITVNAEKSQVMISLKASN